MQVAVAISIKERTRGAPAAGAYPGACSFVFEGAVAAIAEQGVRAPVRDVEIETTVTVVVADACAVSPLLRIDPCAFGDVLELPSSEIAVEGVAVWDSLAIGTELGGGHGDATSDRGDVVLRPEVDRFPMLDFSAFDEIVAAGRTEARAVLAPWWKER